MPPSLVKVTGEGWLICAAHPRLAYVSSRRFARNVKRLFATEGVGEAKAVNCGLSRLSFWIVTARRLVQYADVLARIERNAGIWLTPLRYSFTLLRSFSTKGSPSGMSAIGEA